jgi:hypothetical protein
MPKQFQKYYRKAREARGKPVRESLLLEVVDALSDPPVQFQSFVWFVNQIPSNLKIKLVSSLGAAPASKPSLLRRGFLNPSKVPHDLPKPQNCPIGDGQFGGIVVWDKGGKLWGGGDGGVGDFLVPLDIYHPFEMDEWDYSPDPLDWDYDKEKDPALALLDAIEEDFHK